MACTARPGRPGGRQCGRQCGSSRPSEPAGLTSTSISSMHRMASKQQPSNIPSQNREKLDSSSGLHRTSRCQLLNICGRCKRLQASPCMSARRVLKHDGPVCGQAALLGLRQGARRPGAQRLERTWHKRPRSSLNTAARCRSWRCPTC